MAVSEHRVSISNWKWIMIAAAGSLCLAAWVILGVGLFVHFNVRIWTLIVTAAAVLTELFFWVLAATLGVSVFQARRRLWAHIIKLGQKRP
jgi:hypothetical protein